MWNRNKLDFIFPVSNRNLMIWYKNQLARLPIRSWWQDKWVVAIISWDYKINSRIFQFVTTHPYKALVHDGIIDRIMLDDACQKQDHLQNRFGLCIHSKLCVISRKERGRNIVLWKKNYFKLIFDCFSTSCRKSRSNTDILRQKFLFLRSFFTS